MNNLVANTIPGSAIQSQRVPRSQKTKKNLNITEEQFDELYPDLIGQYDHFNEPVPRNIHPGEFENRYLRSKLWRLNNIYTVINKDGNPVTFRMNYAQHKVYSELRKHPRIIILKSRQQGISTFFLVSYFDDGIFCSFLNIGLMAQGSAEAASLLERSKLMWDKLSPDIKQTIGVSLNKNNRKEFAFSNGSTVFIRVSFRSTTLQRLHVSEFGKIANENPQRAKETKTGTLQALGRGNYGAIESTAEGDNEFKTMWDAAELAEALAVANSSKMSAKDFKPVFLSWLNDPDCREPEYQAPTTKSDEYFKNLFEQTGLVPTQEQMNFWIVQYRELGDYIYQEYPATPEEAFTAARDGTYYAKLFKLHIVKQKRLIPNLYDPNLQTEVYFDLGVDDYFVLVFVQYYDGIYRIVGEYWNNGYDLEHYIDYIIDSPFDVSSLVFPHDIQVRDLVGGNAAGRATTRLDKVREMLKLKGKSGWTLRVLPKASIAEGIELVKQMLKVTYIDTACAYIQSCCLNYTKEWDEKQEVWKATPLHNVYSHGADVLRQVAQGVQKSLAKLKSDRTPKTKSYGGHDV